MVINFSNAAPFGAAFEAHKEEIRAAIEQAVVASAAKMGDSASQLFAIETWGLNKPLKQAA